MIRRTIPHLDLAQIAASGQCFTWGRGAAGSWTIPAGERLVTACQRGEELTFSCDMAEFDAFWAGYFDLDTDYGALKASVDPADRYLTAAVAHGGGIRILRQDFWEVLVSFLISQNNNITRITRSMALLRERYGKSTGGFRAFPRPDGLTGVSEADFRDVGLGYRAKYLTWLSRELAGGGLEALERTLSDAGDEEAERALWCGEEGGRLRLPLRPPPHGFLPGGHPHPAGPGPALSRRISQRAVPGRTGHPPAIHVLL